MPRKTAEDRTREYDDAKARRPKVLMHKDVIIPEFFRSNSSSAVLQVGSDHYSNSYPTVLWSIAHKL
jgi:hypothetical protein